MSDKKRTVLMPQYMHNFRCIGSACEECCCSGFLIYIDHKTYKKYQEVRDAELAPLLGKYVTRNRVSNQSEEFYAKLKMLEDTKCPFLNEEGLCKIQLKCGEEYLSDSCTIYPRIINFVNGVLERSAAMSCPEAARKALLNPDRMEFDESEEPASNKNIYMKKMNTQDPKLDNKPEKYLWELRIFTITVLQDRNYTLSERLILLGMFYMNLQELVSSQKTNEINRLITTYSNILEKGSLRDSLASIPTHYNIQIELLKKIAEIRLTKGVPSKRYLECFTEYLHGIQYTAETKIEELGQHYQNVCKEYYEPFMSKHEYILENYLVNHVFKSLFPFTGEKSIFDSYMMLILYFALIKMHLIGMGGFHKGLTVELVLKLIQSFSKAVDHNQKYLDEIAELMRQNGFNTLPYMAILIKN